MSSPSGSTASDDKILEGSKEEVEPDLRSSLSYSTASSLSCSCCPVTAPSASQKRSRLKGSRNKSTLEALAAKATAAASTSVAPQTAGASSSTGVPEKWRPRRLKGSGKKTASTVATNPSPSHYRGRPPGSKNKKASAVFKIAATPARPHTATPPPLGPSRPWLEKPAL
jgi:hypothetical protein